MEAALLQLRPKLQGICRSFKVINYRGKDRLLRELPSRLRGYAQRLRQDERLGVLVLLDRDGDECMELKARLERMARDAGLATKSLPDDRGRFAVVNRLVIRELESWLLGDWTALHHAFPQVPAEPRRSVDPDSRQAWRDLDRTLKGAGYQNGARAKIDVARRVAAHMDLQRNGSGSFRAFLDGLRTLAEQDGAA